MRLLIIEDNQRLCHPRPTAKRKLKGTNRFVPFA